MINALMHDQFSPLHIQGCKLWLEADYGITLSGSKVSGWADQSGLGRNLIQPTDSVRPSYSAGAVNGYPKVTFGAGIYMNFVAQWTGGNAPGFTCVVVVDHVAGQTGWNAILRSQNNASVYWANDKPQIYVNTGSATSANVQNDLCVGVFRLIPSNTAKITINGSTETITKSFTDGVSTFPCLSYGSETFRGDKIAVCWWNRILSDNETSQISRHYGAKYGIAVA
jgi:hypothetical protein